MCDAATAAAENSARAAGVELRVLHGLGDVKAASALFAEVWHPTDPVPYELLHAIAFAGNYVAGAFAGDELAGAAVGFFDADGSLHSHVAAVRAGTRGRTYRGIGFALKLHQRAWCLHRGISVVTWTFDPLVRRNAYFNLAKLAAGVRAYTEDFYGEMSDELNAGDPSDRLIIEWRLDDPAVARAATGSPRVPEFAGTRAILTEGPDGTPVPAEPSDAARSAPPADAAPPASSARAGQAEPHADAAPSTDGRLFAPGSGAVPFASSASTGLTVATPADVAALRARDPERARAWRFAQRETLGRALAGGYRVAGFTRSGEYVLAPVPFARPKVSDHEA